MIMKERTKSSTTLGDTVLAFFLVQTAAIGLLPTIVGWDSLSVCSWGTLSFGMYALVRPRRIMYRMKPKVPPAGSPPELCVRDLLQAWALFCVALGAMGLAVRRALAKGENTTENSITNEAIMDNLQFEANAIFLLVGLMSMLWDWHLMKSKHWEAENFLLVNLAANAAISIAAASGMIKSLS